MQDHYAVQGKSDRLYERMTRKKRKISELTVGDVNTLLEALNRFQDNLDDNDEDLPSAYMNRLR
jgi:hypothetical protein